MATKDDKERIINTMQREKKKTTERKKSLTEKQHEQQQTATTNLTQRQVIIKTNQEEFNIMSKSTMQAAATYRLEHIRIRNKIHHDLSIYLSTVFTHKAHFI